MRAATRDRTDATRDGFSLVEVLCALLIFGFALVGLTHGVTASIQGSKAAERHSQAVLLASGRLEELRAESWIITGEDEGEFTGAMAAYRWTQSIEDANLDGLYSVTVQILHESSEEPVFELQTMLFERPTESLDSMSAGERRDRRERERRYGGSVGAYGGSP